MRKTFCDVCTKEIEEPSQWHIRLAAEREYHPKERGEVSIIFPPYGFFDKETCSKECFKKLLQDAIAEVDALPQPKVVIVCAPGDLCAGTRIIGNGIPLGAEISGGKRGDDCPGCRGCK